MRCDERCAVALLAALVDFGGKVRENGVRQVAALLLDHGHEAGVTCLLLFAVHLVGKQKSKQGTTQTQGRDQQSGAEVAQPRTSSRLSSLYSALTFFSHSASFLP